MVIKLPYMVTTVNAISCHTLSFFRPLFACVLVPLSGLQGRVFLAADKATTCPFSHLPPRRVSTPLIWLPAVHDTLASRSRDHVPDVISPPKERLLKKLASDLTPILGDLELYPQLLLGHPSGKRF